MTSGHATARPAQDERRTLNGLPRAGLRAALAFTSWSLAVVTSGGIDLRALGLPLVARTPWPTTLAAALFAAACVAIRRAAVLDDVAAVVDGLRRHAMPAALGIALATGLVSARLGTFAVGGSDSNCYVEQAERWAAGTMLAPVAPGFTPDWPNASLSLTPTGFVPSRRVEGAIAPICPSGLSLIMAVPRALGAPRVAVFYVVPVFAAIAVLCTFLLGGKLAGPLPGLAAATLTAASPVFLYQSLQPMSDVPATALWLVALACAAGATATASSSGHGALRGARSEWHEGARVRRRVGGLVGAGLAAGAAALVRPNLAPLALFIVGIAALCGTAGPPFRVETGKATRCGVARACLFRAAVVALALFPAVIAVGLVHQILYGSPFSSGYGSPGFLFRAEHVPANLARFPRWLVETQSLFVLGGLVAPLVVWMTLRARACRHDDETGVDTRRAGHLCLSVALWLFTLAAFAAYLPYVPFDGWWFLRFWLPGIPPLTVLAVAAAAAIGARAADGRILPHEPGGENVGRRGEVEGDSPHHAALRLMAGLNGHGAGDSAYEATGRPRRRTASANAALATAGLLACVGLAAWQLGVARDRSVFQLQRLERKFIVSGQYVATLPQESVVLTIWHSGAVNYYAGRPVVVWDALPARHLDAAIDSLQRQGREVFLLLEPWEEPSFRERFAGSSDLARLDWPPRARFGTAATLWAIADRQRFLRGEPTVSDRVWVR